MRLKIIIAFIVFIVLLLVGRVYYLSIVSNEHFEKLSQKNYIKKIYNVASRGSILDRNGKYLAVNRVGFSISIKPHLRSKNKFENVEEVASLIVKYFPKFKYEKLLKKYKQLDSPYRHGLVKIVDHIAYDDFFKYYTIFNSNENVEIQSSTLREYLYNDIGAHVLGYMGKTTKKDIEKDEYAKYYDTSGRSGVEKYYDRVLRGSLGYEEVKVNSLYQKIKVLNEVKAEKKDINLTIDIELQKYIHELFGDKAGAVIVMDSNNGEILAAGSYPEFDNNLFVNGISHKDWQNIMNNFNHPFTNKLVNGHYPPGSVIKMGVAHSFMENGLGRNYEVFASGEIELGNRKFRDWKKGGHGLTGYTKAIRQSVDVFFYKGSLKVGIDKIHDTLDRYGIGQQTGVDLPNEFKGVNPNKEWKKKKYNIPWYIGETVVSSIGQGYILVTPMQVARYTAALTNGELPTPHFIKSDELNSKKQKVGIGNKELKLLQKGMYEVANHENGTASKHIRSKVKIAAKTGTAQVVSIPQSEKERMKEHELEYFQRSQAWLTTYAPYKNPKYVVTILVEHGGHGGSAAGPMAGKIYDKLLELGYISEK